NVYVLRKTLRSRWNQETIETIPRRGYRFTANVGLRAEQPLAQPTRVAVKRRAPLWRAVGASPSPVSIVARFVLSVGLPHNAAAKSALSPDGARLYEIGRYYWNLRTEDGISKSMQYFAHVIDADPHNARGYAALASANAIMGDYQYGTSKPQVYYDRATAL